MGRGQDVVLIPLEPLNRCKGRQKIGNKHFFTVNYERTISRRLIETSE